MKSTYKIIIRKPQGKIQLERLRCRWKDNINVEIKGTGCEGVVWIHLAQDRDQWQTPVNMVMNLQGP
jgi:hypothetical protein